MPRNSCPVDAGGEETKVEPTICEGKRFQASVLNYKLGKLNIAEVLAVAKRRLHLADLEHRGVPQMV